MPGEFINLCSCKIVNLERIDDTIRLEVLCPVQEEKAGEGSERESEYHAQVRRALLQVKESLPVNTLVKR